MFTDFAALESGQPVFIEMFRGVYRGTVIRHFDRDEVVQVKTSAAKYIHSAWEHMSFRWSDGAADARRDDGRLIVPATMEEQELWEGKARRTAAGFGQLGLGLDLSGPADPPPGLSGATLAAPGDDFAK